MLTDSLSMELISALAWTLVHSVWQITLVALLAALLSYMLRNAKSSTRYLMALGSMLIMLMMALFTFAVYYGQQGASVVTITPMGMVEAPSPLQASALSAMVYLAEAYKDVIVQVWLIGAVLLLLRFTGAYLYLKSVIRSAVREEFTEHKSFIALRKKYEISRSVLIKSSAQVATPMVVGFIKPVILFPIGMINLLSVDEVGAILAHELAHIKRHDYLMNLLQSAVEVIFYYHPGTWYLMRLIHAERENACDDLAIAHTGNPMGYAKTLVRLQEMQGTTLSPALGMAGKRGFAHRIKRILNVPVESGGLKIKLMGFALLMMGLVTLHGKSEQMKGEDRIEDLDIYIIDDCPRDIMDIPEYLDTIPDRNNFHIKKKAGEGTVEMQMEEGRVVGLKINDQEVPSTEYVNLQVLIDSLRPDLDKGMITVFPYCGEDFGNIYYLNENRQLFKMDSMMQNFTSKLKEMEDLNVGTMGFHIDKFDTEVMDSLITEFKSVDEAYSSHTTYRIDSLLDLMPDRLPCWQLSDRADAPVWERATEQEDRPSLGDQLACNLVIDGLVQQNETSSVELSGWHLMINGEKQSQPVWKKYKKIYEEVSEMPMSQGSNLAWEIDPEQLGEQLEGCTTRSFSPCEYYPSRLFSNAALTSQSTGALSAR